jgi:hypothetical protein
MKANRYRVTASVGTWRSLPWPFGILDITADRLRIHSQYWSWWVKNHDVEREDVKSIQILKLFGTTKLIVKMNDGSQLRVLFSYAGAKAVGDLRGFGYPIDFQ